MNGWCLAATLKVTAVAAAPAEARPATRGHNLG